MTHDEAQKSYMELVRSIEVQRLGEQALKEREAEQAYQDVLRRLKRDGYIG